MKVFLICPVRNATQEQIARMTQYIDHLEAAGDRVYYPARDNPYENTDSVGLMICNTNTQAIKEADEVHIFWDESSHGSLFDLGAAFALKKKLRIVNLDDVERTDHKSFANVILGWNGNKIINSYDDLKRKVTDTFNARAHGESRVLVELTGPGESIIYQQNKKDLFHLLRSGGYNCIEVTESSFILANNVQV